MKKGAVVFTSLALLVAFCLPAVAQPSNRAVETIVVDNFDDTGSNEWTWNVTASRFIDSENGFPKQSFFEGQPNSLKFLKQGDESTPKVLGVKTSFLRKGENWFEVYPEKDGKAFEIPLAGHVTQIDFWVWGAKYLYYIDLLVRDADGRVYTLPAGNLTFAGWKNIIVPVPTYIRQRSRLRSGPKTMMFVGFRIRTDPNEYVDDFNVFFDQLKYTTNSLSNIYDGYELTDIDFGGSSSSGSTNTTSSTGDAK
ncbi:MULTISPECIES: flagellar filament outer layer protein FlaA [Treponema]|jgi:hypothetical protein|uniref:Flagellar filament outer layer protein FlaA n=1 Tax=Treponema saccharophilum DSM 2985 TaxID=907348 RepID=H7ENS8_9SPIR|nr:MULTISPECIES: flagellar filament outer layer protein FlaA [Treponema]EIC00561.1 flagellar filament outer layer protein FlaA [Treponema saccharophilum DSM 2985]MBQ5537415.1 flagellar filament protein FlaA [Treponema sp.]BDC95649.1 membrane protein [Treponema saccharophilum]